jgi:hypothetical protein
VDLKDKQSPLPSAVDGESEAHSCFLLQCYWGWGWEQDSCLSTPPWNSWNGHCACSCPPLYWSRFCQNQGQYVKQTVESRTGVTVFWLLKCLQSKFLRMVNNSDLCPALSRLTAATNSKWTLWSPPSWEKQTANFRDKSEFPLDPTPLGHIQSICFLSLYIQSDLSTMKNPH